MKLLRHRNDLWFAFVMLVFTVAWGIIGLPWLVQPVLMDFGGIGSDTDVERIHARFPNFLLDPATLENSGEDVWMAWISAEFYTRLAIVAGSWFLVAAMIWLLDWHSRKTEIRRITTWTPR